MTIKMRDWNGDLRGTEKPAKRNDELALQKDRNNSEMEKSKCFINKYLPPHAETKGHREECEQRVLAKFLPQLTTHSLKQSSCQKTHFEVVNFASLQCSDSIVPERASNARDSNADGVQTL